VSRYLRLLVLALAAAALLGLVSRLPRPRPAAPPAPAAAPAISLEIVIQDGALTPETASVPKDRRVTLAVLNRGSRACRLALSGYEDRLGIGIVAPGGAWRGEFLADRPGDEFAWLLDGRPAGRFSVTGSHLVEGHR
jgi:hypothetical protein